MVLHWRRCGRAGGRQNYKKCFVRYKLAHKAKNRQIRCREENFIIDTGKDEQQLIAANPISRALLLMIKLVLPVIEDLKPSDFQ